MLLSGACTGHNGSGPVDCTGGHVTNGGCVLASRITGRQVAAQVRAYPLPPMNSRRLPGFVAPLRQTTIRRPVGGGFGQQMKGAGVGG